MATQTDLEFVQGDDPDLLLVVTRSGERVDITGKRVELLVKPTRQSLNEDKLFQLSTTTGDIVITDAVLGEVRVPLADRLENPGIFWYRAWVSDLSDETLNRSTFLFGLWTVLPT
jgi:hypothetical protein